MTFWIDDTKFTDEELIAFVLERKPTETLIIYTDGHEGLFYFERGKFVYPVTDWEWTYDTVDWLNMLLKEKP